MGGRLLRPSCNKPQPTVVESTAPASLADLPRIGLGRVLGVQGDDDTAQRLRELGFTPGTEVQFVRRAPFGGPLIVQLRGYQLCLRATEARRVQVEAPGGRR